MRRSAVRSLNRDADELLPFNVNGVLPVALLIEIRRILFRLMVTTTRTALRNLLTHPLILAGEETMSESTRRKFLHDVSVGLGTAAVAGSSPILAGASSLAAQ